MDDEAWLAVRATLSDDTLPTLENLLRDLRPATLAEAPEPREALVRLALIGPAARHNAAGIAEIAILEDDLTRSSPRSRGR